jgi:phenylacetate-coenzyme A ligase PaaK-like adenylate-forming protein
MPELKLRLAGELKARGLRAVVELMEPGTLTRTEFKARRVIDRRRIHDEITDRK